MRKLKWFKVGEDIPDQAIYMNRERIVVDQDEEATVRESTHLEYLYELREGS